MDHNFYPTSLNGEDLYIGIVQARFNEPMRGALRGAYVAELEQLGVTDEDVLLVTVPSALEVLLALQKMAESGQFDALIVLDAVICGETHHFEPMSNESGVGVTRVGPDFNTVIANDVLTTGTDARAHVRTHEKGRDCVHTAVEMANPTDGLNGLQDHGQNDNGEDE